MGFSIFINFAGNCKEAVEFYASVFGAEMKRTMKYSDAPASSDYPVKEEEKNFIMYTEMEIGGSTVMFSDVPTDMEIVIGGNISPTVTSKNMEDIKNWFNKMKDGGTILMEVQETFWSKCYGSVIDKFGVAWQFSYEGTEA